eukprot:TRINITY_DN1690_c1_g4_i1.p1 TRINITY_DN1690_c1_g4~~TRINITY_DN1690_c1_g4_i1.p1  ORF type:complete len:430 (+),score=85.28 TRINITY_DN1690_c1_g4_i1:65-1291(+)
MAFVPVPGFWPLPAYAAPAVHGWTRQLQHSWQSARLAGTALHLTGIPIDMPTSTIKAALSENMGVHLDYVEVKRGTHTACVSAFAIARGVVDLGVQGAEHCRLESRGTVAYMRIELSKDPPTPPPRPDPQSVVHIRVMAKRAGWGFALKALTWDGLAATLELAVPGSSGRVTHVANDNSGQSRQAHSENFMCGFFVEAADIDQAVWLVTHCNDKLAMVAGQDFLLTVEYAKRCDRLYGKQRAAGRKQKGMEFARARTRALDCLPSVADPTNCPDLCDNHLFSFFDQEDAPKWFQTLLPLSTDSRSTSEASAGPASDDGDSADEEQLWDGSVRSLDGCRRAMLEELRLEAFDNALEEYGVYSFLDMQALDECTLRRLGMSAVDSERLVRHAHRTVELLFPPLSAPQEAE